MMTLPISLENRLLELATLGPGWFEPDSAALDQNVLASFRALLAALLAGGVPQPFVYPTPEGALQAEWSFPTWEVTVAVYGTGIAHAHTTHLDSDKGGDLEMSVSSPELVPMLKALILERSR